jgi:hypothetical protein
MLQRDDKHEENELRDSWFLTEAEAATNRLVQRAMKRGKALRNLPHKEWAEQMNAVVESIRASGPELSDAEIDALFAERRCGEHEGPP